MASVRLTRENLLASKARRFVEVELPELGGTVRLGSLSAKAALELRELRKRQDKGEDLEREQMLLLLREGIVDDAGKPMFDQPSLEEFLSVIPPEVSTSLMQKITALLAPAPPAKAAAGNSAGSQSGS